METREPSPPAPSTVCAAQDRSLKATWPRRDGRKGGIAAWGDAFNGRPVPGRTNAIARRALARRTSQGLNAARAMTHHAHPAEKSLNSLGPTSVRKTGECATARTKLVRVTDGQPVVVCH